MAQQYKYFAFISYNHRDEKWAKWLHKKLESYRLPTEIHNEIEACKYLRPVFRDQEELNTGVLSDELGKKLEASKFLIVICSPNSAKSKWVSNEVKAFIEMGRLEYITPFIIDGTPNSGVEEECFPAALREYVSEHPDRELLGVNIKEVGRPKSVIRVISRMLDVDFDALWKRHERARRRRMIAWAIAVVAVIAAIAGAWMTNQPVDVSLHVKEASVHNEALPQIDSAIVSLMLDNETKTATISSLDEPALFANIPHHFIGQDVRVLVACKDYIGLDTIVRLNKDVTINVYRNPAVYGNVHFRLWNPERGTTIPNVKVMIEGQEVISDATGMVTLTVPLKKQKQKYHVTSISPVIDDTIVMPCGDDDVISVQ